MKNKVILVSGSTDGIGKQTALELAETGAHVIIHGRKEEHCKRVKNEIRKITGNENISIAAGDLSELQQVKDIAEKVNLNYDRLDILINNAGVYKTKKEITMDGFEETFAVNHLAPFLLTYLLLPLIKRSAPARIINVSSIAHQRGVIEFDNLNSEKHFDAYSAYANSKLANVIFTFSLADELSDIGVNVNCLHPGTIGTKLLHKGFNMEGSSVVKGAETPVYVALSGDVQNITGKYFVNREAAVASTIAHDKNIQRQLNDYCSSAVGLK